MNHKPSDTRACKRGLLAGFCAAAFAIAAAGHAPTATADEVKSAVKTGNDPRDFAHKVTPYLRYDKRRGDIETTDYNLFFMVPFSFPGSGTPSAFTFESPLVRDLEVGDVVDETGTADWTMRLILKPAVTDFPGENMKASHVFFVETTVPSGEEGITSDQTILSPGYGPIISNSPNWFFAPIFFYDYSLENKSGADDVERLRGRIFYQYAWKNGVYVLPEVQVVWDLDDDEFTANILPEIGYVYKRPPKLESSLRPTEPPGGAWYLKGGPGVNNDNDGDLDWRLEIGHRFLW
ncbi:MAG: hypothetical protein QNJ85_04645 [Gammaproteobacteria bacterium]|nr:hypothetical protein [Gammaproteobacteria bacterium]